MSWKTILTPYFLDQPLPGLELLKQPDWTINRVILPPSSVMDRLTTLHAALARSVQDTLSGGDLPVSIAGDCCSAIAVSAGLQRAGLDPLLIWFDAHGDFNTWETTPSGFLGGMPLAILAGRGEQTLLESLELAPLPEEHIFLTDARDLDPGERDLVANSSLRHLQNPLDLLDLPLGDQPIWVHFDTDIVNPEEVPAQNYPARGGPSSQDLTRVFRHLAETGLITAVSLSSWAPDLPGAEQSREISLALLRVLIQD